MNKIKVAAMMAAMYVIRAGIFSYVLIGHGWKVAKDFDETIFNYDGEE